MKIKKLPFYYGDVQQDFGKAVIAGDWVILSGVSGREWATGHVKEVDVKVQTEVIWAKIKSILEECGTSLDNIVRRVIYFVDVKDYDHYYAATAKFLARECPDLLANPPAETIVKVAGLFMEEMLIEIDVTAVLPDK